MEELIYTREIVNTQIRRIKLEQDLQDSDQFTMVTSREESPSTRSSRRFMNPPSASSRTPTTPNPVTPMWGGTTPAPSETPTQCSGGTSGAGKVGDVPGLEVLFGEIPVCHCGHRSTSSESNGQQSGKVLSSMPQRIPRTVPVLHVDRSPTVPRPDSLEVPGRSTSTSRRGIAGDDPEEMPASSSDPCRHQCPPGQGDLQDLHESSEDGEEESGSEGSTQVQTPDCGKQQREDWQRHRGVPEVPAMEEGHGSLSENLSRLPDKQVRKIKAAIRDAVSFWRQIQAMLTGHGTEESDVSKIMRQMNAEICQELYLHPEGSKRSHQIAEIMGLKHHQLKLVAEVFNPGCFGKRTQKHQLAAGKAFDIELGSDLRDRNKQKEVLRYLRSVKPGLVTVAPPCRLRSQLQNLSKNKRMNSPVRMKKFIKEHQEAMELLNFAVEVCELCIELGLKFVFEHPLSASSWMAPSLRRLLAAASVIFCKADQCAFGLRGPEGGLHRKSTGFATNSESIAAVLSQRCKRDHQHEVIIGGNKSQLAQKYPDKLIDAILSAYKKEIKDEIEIMSLSNVVAANHKKDAWIKECLADLDPLPADECLQDSRHQGQSCRDLHGTDPAEVHHSEEPEGEAGLEGEIVAVPEQPEEEEGRERHRRGQEAQVQRV